MCAWEVDMSKGQCIHILCTWRHGGIDMSHGGEHVLFIGCVDIFSIAGGVDASHLGGYRQIICIRGCRPVPCNKKM